MKFHIRLGTATLAGVFALSAIGAAQAEDASPSETSTTETSPTASPTPDSQSETATPEDDSEDSSAPADTSVECGFEYDADPPSTVITIPDHVQFDRVTVEVDDEPVDEVSVDAHTATLNIDASDSFIEVSMWQDDQLQGDCSDRAEAEEDADSATPTPTPTGETTTPDDAETTTPDDDSPDPTTPEPEPETSEPEPSVVPSPSESATPVPPEHTESADVTPQPTPLTSQAPVEPAPPQYDDWELDPTSPTESEPQPSQASSERVERDIRQYSENPRHVLSQIWNTDSHNGSGLIMPRPRDSNAKATELETLPPVSEDELNAIKARVSTQDKGSGLDADDMLRSDVNERLAHSDTWWLVSSVVGLVLLGAGVWWAVARRRPRH